MPPTPPNTPSVKSVKAGTDTAHLSPLEEQPCCLSTAPHCQSAKQEAQTERKEGLGQVLSRGRLVGQRSAGLDALLSAPRNAYPGSALSALLTGAPRLTPPDDRRTPANEEMLKFGRRMQKRQEALQHTQDGAKAKAKAQAPVKRTAAVKSAPAAASVSAQAELGADMQLQQLGFALPQPVLEALQRLKAQGRGLTAGQKAKLQGQQKRSFEAAELLFAQLQPGRLPPLVYAGVHLLRLYWQQSLGKSLEAKLKQEGHAESWLITQLGFLCALLLLPRQQGFMEMTGRLQHQCALSTLRTPAFCLELLDELYAKRSLLLQALQHTDFYHSFSSFGAQLQRCSEACLQCADQGLELERLQELCWSFKFKAVHELLQSRAPAGASPGAFEALLASPLKLDPTLPWDLFEPCVIAAGGAALGLRRRQYTSLQLMQLLLVPLIWELTRSLQRLPPPLGCKDALLLETAAALRRSAFIYLEQRGSQGTLIRLRDLNCSCDLLPAIMRCLHLNPPSEILSLKDFKARFNFESLKLPGKKGS